MPCSNGSIGRSGSASQRSSKGSWQNLSPGSRTGYLPPFQAGQYLNLVVEVGNIITSRDYSISSPPSQIGWYDITLRRGQDGFVSEYLLDEVRVGSEFTSSPPSGNFYHNPLFHGDDLVFIAGGSGVTPFMSMIREAAGRGLNRRIHLVYGNRTPDDVINNRELEEISPGIPHPVTTVSPSPQGAGATPGSSPPASWKGPQGLSDKMFYHCRPEAMYAFCLEELKKAGIPRRRIRVEMYGPPKDVTRCQGWTGHIGANAVVKVSIRGGRTITVPSTEPLMNSLERSGIVLPSLCRSGECSLCRTKLLEGGVPAEEIKAPEG